MRTIDRVMAVLAVVFFFAAVISGWRVSVAEGQDLWYVPLLLALASAAMTFGALHHRIRKTVEKEK
ncbi:MAG TPA: hypothetical protein H9828_08640 [Candidatus Alistipes intestinigallinarum]|mgnify:CR=1 FL=1|uniref:Uncharacterized protein n=1 Tax=Candidatus Alistipes intestinigallinarum TaxID=2838440 RepID=A0A9D2CDC8_9BACT|nr:hypothetical protein [Candidatus Alistipes intestinigallinarum]